jgi:hypothetical protein
MIDPELRGALERVSARVAEILGGDDPAAVRGSLRQLSSCLPGWLLADLFAAAFAEELTPAEAEAVVASLPEGVLRAAVRAVAENADADACRAMLHAVNEVMVLELKADNPSLN